MLTHWHYKLCHDTKLTAQDTCTIVKQTVFQQNKVGKCFLTVCQQMYSLPDSRIHPGAVTTDSIPIYWQPSYDMVTLPDLKCACHPSAIAKMNPRRTHTHLI
jgi:hypothetical protein